MRGRFCARHHHPVLSRYCQNRALRVECQAGCGSGRAVSLGDRRAEFLGGRRDVRADPAEDHRRSGLETRGAALGRAR